MGSGTKIKGRIQRDVNHPTIAMQPKHHRPYQTIINAPGRGKFGMPLIDRRIVKQYFFGSDQKSEWKVGSQILWSGEYDGKSYQDKGTVLEFIPQKRIAYSYLSNWSGLEDKPENYLHVSYDLEQLGEGTQLTIAQTNYDEERRSIPRNWKRLLMVKESSDVIILHDRFALTTHTTRVPGFNY